MNRAVIALDREIIRAMNKLLNDEEFKSSEREESLKAFRSRKVIARTDVEEWPGEWDRSFVPQHGPGFFCAVSQTSYTELASALHAVATGQFHGPLSWIFL